LASPREEPSQGQFGKYRIVRRIASGGMADIFLAVLDGPDGFFKTCVIKRILPEYANLDVFSRMFAGEAKVAALLNHPNIVQVFDFGKIDGQYYLAMEWIQGASLDKVVKRAAKAQVPLGPRMAVNVGIALAEALAYAHQKTLPDGTPLKLVHRDITPGNVLVSREGQIKLADFGIVKSSANLERTAVGVVKGKYAYMSPEQIANRDLDSRSDLFSLGIVLWELVTGKHLFKRDTLQQTILAISKAEAPAPTSLNPECPPALEQAVLKALAVAPEARYQSAAELHADLEQLRSSQHWTSGGREIGLMMVKLFPVDASEVFPTPIPSLDLVGTGKAPSNPSLSLDVTVDTEAATMDEERSSQLSDPQAAMAPPPSRFPWLLVAAVGAAIMGTILFWSIT